MSSRKCFVYCNECAGYIIHDSEESHDHSDVGSDSCSIYCNKCKHVVTHAKFNGHKFEHCLVNNKHDDHHDDCEEDCDLETTLISVRDPTSNIYINSPPVVNLTGWTDQVCDVLDSFDNESGVYVAPCAGDYEVSLVVNFRTAFPISLDTPPLDVNPTSVYEPDNDPFSRVPRIELYDVCTGDPILGSQVPVVHSIIIIPSPITGDPPIEVEIRSLLGAGQVVINGVVPLCQCQQVGIRFVLNGLEFPIPPPIPVSIPAIDLSPPGSSTTLSIKKLRDIPKHCETDQCLNRENLCPTKKDPCAKYYGNDFHHDHYHCDN